MNDPCAPGYDPRTGLFHLFYQWTPHSHRWDRIAWGHATSRDLVRWEHDSGDVSRGTGALTQTPALRPDTAYDKEGVFTGCFWPAGPRGEPALSVFYTNVCAVPIHYSKPYIRGCEGLALATSTDGRTWTKHTANPILPEEPAGLDVTGFRDPYVAPWAAMDRARGTEGRLYGFISGGIRGEGPRVFLYDVDPADLTRWTYLRPLAFEGGGRWGGDLGRNIECTNFMTLACGVEREVVVTGSEGGAPRPRGGEPHYGPWMMGTLEGGEFATTAAGMVDWGGLYAFNTFLHEGRRILWGWLVEEDLPEPIRAERGWTGCLGVPRELFLASYAGVTGTLKSQIADVGSFETLPSGEVITVGIRPLAEFAALRGPRIPPVQENGSRFRFDGQLACVINLMVQVTDETDEVALHVRVSEGGRVSIVFHPQDEVIKVYREQSNAHPDIVKSTEEGPFTLLRSPEIERLRMTVLLDGDVIEVFANERFALATRAYSPPEATGVLYEHKGRAQVELIELWEMRSAESSDAHR
jgi:beta-fructofuranosidase